MPFLQYYMLLFIPIIFFFTPCIITLRVIGGGGWVEEDTAGDAYYSWLHVCHRAKTKKKKTWKNVFHLGEC